VEIIEQIFVELIAQSRSDLRGAFARALLEILWLSQDQRIIEDNLLYLYEELSVEPPKRAMSVNRYRREREQASGCLLQGGGETNAT
jgi:hypothetical protein